MFERRVSTSIGDGGAIEVETLDRTDSAVHLCVNAALGGARRLRNLVDLDLMVRHPEFDAREFACRVNTAGLERMVAVLLDRCRRLLGTPIPVEIDQELDGHRVWAAANALVDRCSRPISKPLPPGFVLAAGRSTLTGTSSALWQNSRHAIMTRLGSTSPTASDEWLNWNRLPPDGEVDAARQRYLDWVDQGDDQSHAR